MSLGRQADRRRASRTALALCATVREPRRGRYGATIVDMSTHGCRIESTSTSISEQWVWISIAGLETQYCRVVWQDSGFAGLEFAAPLNDSVFERLLAGHKAISERLVVQLQEIARRASRAVGRSADDEQSKALLEFSRECAERAAIHGLQIGSARSQEDAPAQLTGSLVRRTSSHQDSILP